MSLTGRRNASRTNRSLVAKAAIIGGLDSARLGASKRQSRSGSGARDPHASALGGARPGHPDRV